MSFWGANAGDEGNGDWTIYAFVVLYGWLHTSGQIDKVMYILCGCSWKDVYESIEIDNEGC